MNLFSKKGVVLFSACSIFFSCTSDEKDEVVVNDPPSAVSNVIVSAQNQAVLLEWDNPTDTDLNKIVLKYDGKTENISKTDENFLVENLVNKTAYTFTITAVDLDGNESPNIAVTATPDQYVKVYEGTDVVSGLYSKTQDDVTTQVTIDGDTYKRELQATSNTQYFWEGTLVKNVDETFTFDIEFYSIGNGQRVHAADLVETTNVAFSFQYKDEMRFASVVPEKLEGDANFIEGKYESIKNTTSPDSPSFNEDVTFEVEYKANGDLIKTSRGQEDTTTWTNQDLLDEKIIFVRYNSKIYVIENPSEYIALQ